MVKTTLHLTIVFNLDLQCEAGRHFRDRKGDYIPRFNKQSLDPQIIRGCALLSAAICFKRRLPAKNIHSVTIVNSPIIGRIQNQDFVMEEALKDFRQIFFNEQSEELVILMFSLFAFSEINQDELESAQRTQDREERENLVEYAFQKFDSFAKRLNYLFDQFCINLVITRSGIIPRQDDRITKEILTRPLKLFLILSGTVNFLKECSQIFTRRIILR